MDNSTHSVRTLSLNFIRTIRTFLAVGFALSVLGSHADVVINEIDYDQPSSDIAEFIELYNTADIEIDLSTYSMQFVNGNGGSVYATINLNGLLPAGGYYVLCGDVNTVVNCDLEIASSIQNGAPDAVALLESAVIVDTVSYEGDTVAPYTEGSGAGLSDNSGGGTSGPNVFKSIARIPNGNDTDQNNIDLQFVCITPGTENLANGDNCMAPAVDQLVINEIDYRDPDANDSEFIELFNSGNTDLDLTGYFVDLIDGATQTTYQTILLPSVILNAGNYLVICSSASVANCDVVTALGDDFIEDGSPDAVTLSSSTELLDALSYDGSVPSAVEGSGVGLIDIASEAAAGLSRFPDGIDTNSNNTDFSVRCSTPGAPNTAISTACAGGNSIEIFAIQGNGTSSPLDGQIITTNDNIVTGVGPEGFFIQTPTARTDNDSDTSDGLYVFTGTAPTVSVGDQVDVTGTVDEFFDFTELTNSPLVSVDSNGNALPAPVVLDGSVPSPVIPQSPIELERFEGMLATTMAITSGPTDQFGDVPVTAQPQRPFREPGILSPGLPNLPVWDGNPEIFEVNPDGLGGDNPNVFGGQAITATGPLAFSFGDYQIWPTSLTFGTAPDLPRPVRARAPGEFTIATQNFQRFFDDVDDPLVDDTILPTANYAIRLQKASAQIRLNLDSPDIVAIQEIESASVMQALADQIFADDPGLVYSVSLLEGNDVGGIDVGYLTRDDTITVSSVSQINPNLLLSFDGSLLNDRPPLLMEATFVADGADFDISVINVHQRSLGGIEGTNAERVKTKRLEQSITLAQFIQDYQSNNPTARLVVIGDFNAFEFTDGYVDVMGQLTGNLDPLGDEFDTTDIIDPNLVNQTLSLSADERYSFVFQGSAQALDHTLTSQTLDGFVSGYQFARANADASAGLQLVLGATPDTPDATLLRSTDHDGAALYITAPMPVDTDGDGISDASDNCTLIANSDQRDTNADGFGNVCDPDLNNDGVINFLDVSLFAQQFNTMDNGDADFNNDGLINFLDFSILPDFFLGPPGPSGIAP